MHQNYEDITSRIKEEPKWFDENGVPRYCEFAPFEVPNIYASTVVFFLIQCQGCHRTFKVAFSESNMDVVMRELRSLKESVLNKSLHYGDPPNIECCSAGPSMNCEDLQVLEFWERKSGNWARNHELEILLPDHPEYERTL